MDNFVDVLSSKYGIPREELEKNPKFNEFIEYCVNFEETTEIPFFSVTCVNNPDAFTDSLLAGFGFESLANMFHAEENFPGIITSATISSSDTGLFGPSNANDFSYSLSMTPEELAMYCFYMIDDSKSGNAGQNVVIDENGKTIFLTQDERFISLISSLPPEFFSDPSPDVSKYIPEELRGTLDNVSYSSYIYGLSDYKIHRNNALSLSAKSFPTDNTDYVKCWDSIEYDPVSNKYKIFYTEGGVVDCDFSRTHYNPKFILYNYERVTGYSFYNDGYNISTLSTNQWDTFVGKYLNDVLGVDGLSMSSLIQTDNLGDYACDNMQYRLDYNDFSLNVDVGSLASDDDFVGIRNLPPTVQNIVNSPVQSHDNLGFSLSVLINQADSEYDKIGVKDIKLFTDVIYDEDSDSYESIPYYYVYLKNGQYVVLDSQESYSIDEINTTINTSPAMKNYKMYDVLTGYYDDSTEIDVKYSNYTNNYEVYVNGERIVLDEVKAATLLNGDNSDALTQVGLPSVDNTNTIKSGSSYMYNKFSNKCISLNDTATYEILIDELKDDFVSNKVNTAKSNFSSCYDSVTPYVESVSKISDLKRGTDAILESLEFSVENLSLQINKSLSLLSSYDVSLKELLDKLINDLFLETSVTMDSEFNFSSNLIGENSQEFLDEFLEKESNAVFEYWQTIEAYKNGYIVISKEDVEKYGSCFSSNAVPLYEGSNIYKVLLEDIKIDGSSSTLEWALDNQYKKDSSGNISLDANGNPIVDNTFASSISTVYYMLENDESLSSLLLQSEKYKNYYTYTSKFADDILSDKFGENLQYLKSKNINSYLFSNSELALLMCNGYNDIDAFVSSTNFQIDSCVNGAKFGIDPEPNLVLFDTGLLNDITNNSLKERMGYVTALKYCDYLVGSDDSTIEDVFQYIGNFNVGFNNGLSNIPNGLWHLYDPSMTSGEYFMQYVNELLNPLSKEQIDDAYFSGTISTEEYKFRSNVANNQGLIDQSRAMKIDLNVGENVGSAVASTALSLASIACPALAPFVTAVQLGSGAGYKAQQYFMQSGMTTEDAWKARLYGVLSSAGSYFVNRAICSFGSSYQRFDAHGNAFFGKSGGNSVLNYASSKLKQMGATEISNIGLLGLDYLFGTDITYKNSLIGRATDAAQNGYVGKYSNNFWLDYLIDTGVDTVLDYGSDTLVRSAQQKYNPNLETFGESDSDEDVVAAKKIPIIDDELDSFDIEICKKLHGQELYDYLVKHNKLHIAEDYKMINGSNVDDWIRFNEKGDDVCVDFPSVGGYDPATVKSLKECDLADENGNIRLSRSGSLYGRASTSDLDSTGAQRGIPNMDFDTTDADLHYSTYIDVVDILRNNFEDPLDDLSLKVANYLKTSNVILPQDISYSDAAEGLVISFYGENYSWILAPEHSGTDGVLRSTGVSGVYGYFGKVAPCKDLPGGATQINTVFSWQSMINAGLLTNVTVGHCN